MERVHADRRDPAVPEQPLELDAAADELLATASEQASGRAARTLTPGAGAALKQTLIAITDGRELDDHVANGPASIQVLRGSLTVSWGDEDRAMQAGQWATLPLELHRVHADSDTVALVTVATEG